MSKDVARFVIIGADAAGMSAASKARRENPDLEIIVLEKGHWVSYGTCGLPYYIKGDVDRLEDLVAVTAERFRKERNIDLRLGHEVTRIDPDNQKVSIKTKEGQSHIGFDHLLIATGAEAIKPKIKGIDSDGVFILHSMESGRAIKDYLKNISPQSAVIVGGGYIGIEMAEALHAHGIKIDLVEMLPQVLNSFGPEMAKTVEEGIKNRVTLHLQKAVREIEPLEDGKILVKIDGGEIVTEMVLVAVGIRPRVSLAQEAGIRLGDTGAIATDACGRTNIPFIYAAGDCAEVKSVVTGRPEYIPLALAANRHGRAIGRTIGGKLTELAPVAGTAAVKAFHLEVAKTGIIDESIARKGGFDPLKVTIDTHSRAGYYPGSKPIKVTLLADKKTKRILGGAIVGEDGAAKRIDTVAAALFGRFTVDQLENLDLAYAPPFSPVWDPVLTAARVLNGKLNQRACGPKRLGSNGFTNFPIKNFPLKKKPDRSG